MTKKNGVIVIDKPAGMSSAKAVARVKKILGVKKAGHAGTLDPFATGLLVCGINKGTKLSRFLLGGEKKYTGIVHLGFATDTLDPTGAVVKKTDRNVLDSLSEDMILTAIAGFKGIQQQQPPVYSALKHNGQPLYRLARQGKIVTKPPREIEIISIAVRKIDLPFVTIDVHCSSGTYIRSLARDIGEKLGCAGHLSFLVRTYACGFSMEDSISLTELENMDKDSAFKYVFSPAESLSFMPVVSVCDKTIDKIKFGQRIGAGDGVSFCSDSVTVHSQFANCKRLQGAADARRRASSRTHVLQVPANAAGATSCKRLPDSFVRIVDKNGELAAVVEYDKNFNRYNYCCVFIS